MKLAVIPARGGSKRIPRKNIRSFCGQPMIAWSIKAAKQSQCFDRLIVSTDDEEIAEIARSHGAEVPFIRPTELADDHAGTISVIAHAIEWHRQHDKVPRYVCCIYATAPFLQADDLHRGLRVLQKTGADYAVPITSYPFPIQRAVRVNPERRLEMFYPQYFHTRSQDLDEAWHDVGQFYWGQSQAWLTGRPILCSDSAPVIMPRYRVQDIDTLEDWERAEWLFKAMQQAG
jgi:N-acylneuraminate cytidylyltransferase